MNIKKIIRVTLFVSLFEVIGGALGIFLGLIVSGIYLQRHGVTAANAGSIYLADTQTFSLIVSGVALLCFFGSIIFAIRHERLKYVFTNRERIAIAALMFVPQEIYGWVVSAHHISVQPTAWAFRFVFIAVVYFSLQSPRRSRSKQGATHPNFFK